MRCLPHRGVVDAPPRRPLHGAGVASALRFARDTRASAGIEFALGAVVLLGIAVTGFAVYSRIDVATSASRIAVAMAEHVSQEEVPDGDRLDALARFLRDHEFGADHAVVVVTTAIRKAAGEPAAVLWTDRIKLGEASMTTELEETCNGKSDANGNADLGAHFTMDDGETVFVVEVCARGGTAPASLLASWTGDVFSQYLLPTRHPDVVPAQPTRTLSDGDGSA